MFVALCWASVQTVDQHQASLRLESSLCYRPTVHRAYYFFGSTWPIVAHGYQKLMQLHQQLKLS